MYRRFISGGRVCIICTEYFHYSVWACKVPLAVTRNVVPSAPFFMRPGFDTIPVAAWLTRVPTCIFHALATYPSPITAGLAEANPNWFIWWMSILNALNEVAGIGVRMNGSHIPAIFFAKVSRILKIRLPSTYPIAWLVEVRLGVLTLFVSYNIMDGTISDVLFSQSLLLCLTGYPFVFFSLSLFFLKTSLFFFLLNSFFFSYPSFLCLASQSFLFLSDSF